MYVRSRKDQGTGIFQLLDQNSIETLVKPDILIRESKRQIHQMMTNVS
jgi:hypothetical protein